MAGIEKSKWLNEQLSSIRGELSRLRSEVNKPKAVREAEAQAKKAEAQAKQALEKADFSKRKVSLENALKSWPQLMKSFTEAKKSDSTLYFSTFLNRGILTNTYSFANSAIKYSADNKTFSINYRDSKWKAHSLSYNTKDYVTAQWKSVNTIKLFLSVNKDIKKVEWNIAKERKENNTVRGVESFDVRQFSKKAQAYLKEKDFLLGNNLNLKPGIGTWIAFDAKWNLHFGKAFIMPKAQIDSSYTAWKFNEAKFKQILWPRLDKKANQYYIAKADKLVKGLGVVTMTSLETENAKITKADKGVKEIEALWVPVSSENKRTIETKKNHIQILKDYKDVSQWMEAKLNQLVKSLSNLKWYDYEMKKNELIKFCNELTDKKAVYNWKNVYKTYQKLKDWENKYNAFVEKAKSKVPQTTILK